MPSAIAVGRRRCGVGHGAVAAPRRAAGRARTRGAGGPRRRDRLRRRDARRRARRHATRCARPSPRKASSPRTSWSRPPPADPFRGDVVVMTRDEYYVGQLSLARYAARPLDGERVPRPRGVGVRSGRARPGARRFLVWARYPAIDVEAAPGGGTLVRFSDVRYRAADRLSGPVVELPASAARAAATRRPLTRPRACAAACPRRDRSTGLRARRGRAI